MRFDCGAGEELEIDGGKVDWHGIGAFRATKHQLCIQHLNSS